MPAIILIIILVAIAIGGPCGIRAWDKHTDGKINNRF